MVSFLNIYAVGNWAYINIWCVLSQNININLEELIFGTFLIRSGIPRGQTRFFVTCLHYMYGWQTILTDMWHPLSCVFELSWFCKIWFIFLLSFYYSYSSSLHTPSTSTIQNIPYNIGSYYMSLDLFNENL